MLSLAKKVDHLPQQAQVAIFLTLAITLIEVFDIEGECALQMWGVAVAKMEERRGAAASHKDVASACRAVGEDPVLSPEEAQALNGMLQDFRTTLQARFPGLHIDNFKVLFSLPAADAAPAAGGAE